MESQFDTVVIGVGMAGLNAARRLQSAGQSVAVVDSRPYGGTCALRGCDPKKVLVGAAEIMDWRRRMMGKGIDGDITINWHDLMQFKRTFTESVPDNLENMLKKTGVATYHGEIQFTDTNNLQIGNHRLTAQHIVIATGARPRDLGIRGAEFAATSTDFLELEQLPERIVFIGGGYISFEFAHIAARAGAQVSIVHRGERPLEGFDRDLVDMLISASEAVGIDVQLNAEVTAIEPVAGHLRIQTNIGRSLDTDYVVHGAGRVPEIDGLNLPQGHVEYNQHGIIVNKYLQSVSNPAVYAAGDAAATEGMPLTPVAVSEGLTVVSNILKGNQRIVDYGGTPSVIFSTPALAKAGLTEAEAYAKGLKFRINYQKTSDWYSSRRTNEQFTGFKVLIEEGTDRILGAHLLGAYAGEVINMFVLAIRHNLTASDIKRTIFVHPAETSDITYMVS
ncbi:MAG: NAD(P)/FAD-dependent oxidoreductase [Chloroflexi bacterium]|nr:MAG: pyridine nucleotide-disulfide oxidoreductase dimerization subunit [Chloroflexi bacterium OLB13]MBV6437581.1 Glutathione amide reductase [Anaerolineae bacterium]NOG48783.1 NAD(P)/FAD-dependent oxidoreductase [Chloroflexota bacterium]